SSLTAWWFAMRRNWISQKRLMVRSRFRCLRPGKNSPPTFVRVNRCAPSATPNSFFSSSLPWSSLLPAGGDDRMRRLFSSAVVAKKRARLIAAMTIAWSMIRFAGTAQAAEVKPAWQQEWEKTLDGAKKEGRLVVHGASAL